jgi:hypothetical protein
MKTQPIQEAIVGPEALALRRGTTAEAQKKSAATRNRWIGKRGYYYSLIERALAFFVEPGERVLSIRSQTGWMLKALKPSIGNGLELTQEMILEAQKANPEFDYTEGFPDQFEYSGKYDAVIIADPGETVDLQEQFRRLKPCCHRATRIYLYGFNSLWQSVLNFGVKIGLKMPQPEQNWLTESDIRGLFELAGFQVLKVHYLALCPIYIPLLSHFCNHILAAIPGVRRLCMIQVFVARPVEIPPQADLPSVSVIIPCRNEEGNIQAAVERLPKLGRETEILFCDDKSTDNTRGEVERMMKLYPEKNIRLLDGPGICKSRNVWTGFDAAQGDILLILDADLAVMPEEMPRFIDAIAENRGEFINGSRLVYPIPHHAMKATNRFGNKVFSWLFSLLLGQRIKDTLCGTKVLWRSDWLRMRKYIDYWGVMDRWGDYDLLLGAAKLNLRIIDLPVHYQERVSGLSKMTRVLYNARVMLTIMWKAYNKMRRYGAN